MSSRLAKCTIMAPLGLLLCVSLAACLQAAGSTSSGVASDRGRPLRAAQLRALLSDVNVAPVQTEGVNISHPTEEIFSADGTYVQIPNRARLYGTFTIQGNAVCVEGDGFDRLCRQVIPRGGQTYSFVNVDDSSMILVTVTRRR
jgi:hypothetical protein